MPFWWDRDETERVRQYRAGRIVFPTSGQVPPPVSRGLFRLVLLMALIVVGSVAAIVAVVNSSPVQETEKSGRLP